MYDYLNLHETFFFSFEDDFSVFYNNYLLQQLFVRLSIL